MNFLDLFAGIGGFALGAEWAGMQFDKHYFSEVDDYAIKVYARRFPDAIPLGDIRGITADELPAGEWVIAGGFPCQDISVAGKGAGLAGARSGLWYEYARIIGELRPRYAIMENVGALAFRGLDSVLGSLSEIGYDAEWQDVRAIDVGAPHRRERIWIVAYPESEHGFRWPEPQLAASAGGQSRDQPAWGSVAGNVADAYEKRLSFTKHEPGKEWSARTSQRPCATCHSWWTTEPDVGGTLDGFSAWLDGLDVINAHKYNMTYGTTKEERSGETLRALRDKIRESPDEWKARGSECVSPQEVLLAYVCKLEARINKQTNLFVESEKTSERSLRSLRDKEKPAGASYRPESEKQSSGKHRDALQALSRLLAYDAEKAWIAYRRENAPTVRHWESGIARVAHGVPSRVDRLKCLGNSIVPQIAEMIFREIKKQL